MWVMGDGPERWQLIRERFLGAVECVGAERGAYLENLKRQDAEAWHEVCSLLAAHTGSDAVLDHVAGDFLATDLLESGDDRWSGRRIGAYVVVALLGRGGMGEVYRGRRADAQYEKEVAIKVVRAGFDTGDLLERFRTERQILANLEHVNVARLLDGGTTEDGLPYLVMELIQGERIDLYCDRERLSVRSRLQLFLQVCAAVQFAHQRLVIHRDLKTGNMLVTREGVPKLLDFGVAKLLRAGDAATETTLFRPLTPAYASPEQIRGESLTTASDVFSLGVILFELLTGASPFDARARTLQGLAQRAGPEATRRASATLHAATANARQSEAGGLDANAVAAARSTTPQRLERQLAGDVDAILMKAMRPEPERRYGSVQQMAEDIERHLSGATVMAHRGSWRYRLGKFASRNKAAVGGVATTVLALAVGLILSVHQAHIAGAERRRADMRFEDTRKLANALIFDVNDAMADTPGNTAARKILLDRAVQYLDKLSKDAAGNTNLQRELAWGYQKLAAVLGNTSQSNVGEIDAADKSLHKAIALFEAVYKANPGSVDDGLNLARIHRLIGGSDIYYPAGPPQITRAAQILDQLAQRQPDNIQVITERSRTYELLAYAQDIAGERLKAVESVRQALALAHSVQPRQNAPADIGQSIALFTVHLGVQLGNVGELQLAEETIADGLQQYVALRQRSDTPELARNAAHAQMLLGRLNAMRGRMTDASANFAQATTKEAQLVHQDPSNSMLMWDVVSLSFDQGRLLVLDGHGDEALPRIAPALQRYALHLEDDSGPGYAMLKAWVALIHLRAGRYAEARGAVTESIAGFEGEPMYADGRSGLAANHVMMGDLLVRQHDFGAARGAYDEALRGASLAEALGRGDIAMVYVLADAQSGMAELFSEQASIERDATLRASLLAQACTYYTASDRTWSQIREPALFSPNMWPAGNPRAVRARLGRCRLSQAANP